MLGWARLSYELCCAVLEPVRQALGRHTVLVSATRWVGDGVVKSCKVQVSGRQKRRPTARGQCACLVLTRTVWSGTGRSALSVLGLARSGPGFTQDGDAGHWRWSSNKLRTRTMTVQPRWTFVEKSAR